MSSESAFVGVIIDRVQTWVKSVIQLRNTTVTAVSPGASRDSRTQVSVLIGTTSTMSPYLDSYTSPALGDAVAVLTVFGSPLILGRVYGLPNF